MKWERYYICFSVKMRKFIFGPNIFTFITQIKYIVTYFEHDFRPSINGYSVLFPSV